MRRKFIVELEVPEGADIEDCVGYIMDAVTAWRGSLRPPLSYGDDDGGDPMFGLDDGTITVTTVSS